MKQRVDALRRFILKITSNRATLKRLIFQTQWHICAIAIALLPFLILGWQFVKKK